MHTPGHWVALTPPDGPQTPQYAALLCDSLDPRPYALSVDELGELLAVIAVRQQTSTIAAAQVWSLYLVTST